MSSDTPDLPTMSLSTSGAVPARSNTTATPQNVTHNYEGMVAQSGSQQINGPVYGNVHYGDSKSQDELVRDRILATLRFEGMDRYHERPLESFPGTYEWMFAEEPNFVHTCVDCEEYMSDDQRYPTACQEMIKRDATVNRTASDFRDWLRHSDQIFWVSGKAGAGKSCLMKFLADHSRTYELLCEWAGTDVTICLFFFWAAGGELERSRKGLLRGLLHQLLSHDREIIEQVLPQRWTATNIDMQHSPPWGEHELRNALTRAVERARESAKLCLFIDGLDEFSGDHQDMIDDLDALNRSPDIKICVSSRPWNIFRHRYGARSEALLLKLHELTYSDLSLYVKERLGPTGTESLFYQYSCDTHITNLQSLILEKAQGVFLWVKLAVNEARRGVGECDSPLELRARLEATPSDINDFIEKIFDSIELVYKKYCAQVLLLLLSDFYEAELPLSRLWCLSQDAEGYCPAWEVQRQKIGWPEVTRLLDESARLANKWCRDLVDVVHDADNEDCDLLICNAENELQSLTLGISLDKWPIGRSWTPDHVIFAHRTFLDLARAKARDGTLWRLAGADFCPQRSAILSLVRLFKMVRLPIELHAEISTCFTSLVSRNGQSCQGNAQCTRNNTILAARGLVESNRVIQQDCAALGNSGSWVQRLRSDYDQLWLQMELPCNDRAPREIVLLMLDTLRWGQQYLFWTILEQQPHLNTKIARHTWLEAAFAPQNLLKDDVFPLRPIAQKLLEAELDLNELFVYEGGSLQSTWQRVLIYIHHLLGISVLLPVPSQERVTGILRLLDIFLAKGADPCCHLLLKPCSSHDLFYHTTGETSLPAVETFELALPCIDDYAFDDEDSFPNDYDTSQVPELKETIKQAFEAIIQRLRKALDARAEASQCLSRYVAPGPQIFRVAGPGSAHEPEQDSDDDNSLALIPHKRRRLDISDILN